MSGVISERQGNEAETMVDSTMDQKKVREKPETKLSMSIVYPINGMWLIPALGIAVWGSQCPDRRPFAFRSDPVFRLSENPCTANLIKGFYSVGTQRHHNSN